MHAHHLISAWVDYFDCDALVFSGREGQRFGPAELLETLWVNDAFECACYLSPRLFVGEEGLGDAEGSAVVVAVEKPRRYFVTACGASPYSLRDCRYLHPPS